MSGINCEAKHTAYQPEGEKWRCPKCGARDGFYIEESDEGAHDDCGKLHARDAVECHDLACRWLGSGATLAKKLARIDNRETCPTCKGCGTVAAQNVGAV